MYYTVYKITNKVNGKYYIGKHQTTNLDDGYMGSGLLISRAIRLHGLENFSKEILFVFDNEQDMNEKEKELVVVSEETYNLCPGGHGGFGYINHNNLSGAKIGFKATLIILQDKYGIDNPSQLPKNRRKSSERLKRLHETNAIKIPDWSGRNHKTETKIKIGEANRKFTGSKNSQYGTCWITNGQENKKIRKEELESWLDKGYKKGRIST